MKSTLIASILLISINVNCQDSFDKIISSGTCDCITQLKVFTEQDYFTCILKAIDNVDDSLLNEFKTDNNDSLFEKSSELGKKVYQRISVSMIFSCNAYYNLMDTLRYAGRYKLNIDSINTLITSLNKRDTTTRDERFYIERGLMYFQVFDMDNALIDFDKVIKSGKHSLEIIFFKALTLELMQKYDEALLLYTDLVKLTNETMFKICAAIVKRKRSGQ